ncbi:MAG: hypothetical protein ACJAZ3_000604 [Sphingobacteriales bacterium]|jgi:hypothetical protein
MQHLIYIFLAVLISTSTFSQVQVVPAVIIDGDTIPVVSLNGVIIQSTRIFKSESERRKYDKLRRDVRKVWPYAQVASQKFIELEKELASVDKRKDQKGLAKQKEQEIREEFEGSLKDLTTTQGAILIKLLDRQTGNTGYEVLQGMRGNVTAFFWQGLARVFGHNLKSEYDLETERDIESIIASIEYEQRLKQSYYATSQPSRLIIRRN